LGKLPAISPLPASIDWLSIPVIAVALAMDAFSVSVSAGMTIPAPKFRHYFRLAFHFGLFQFIMPIIGYFGGLYLDRYIRDYDHWIAFGLLSFIGLKMIREAFTRDGTAAFKRDPSRGFNLIILAVATSIDALAVGLSFGVLNQEIWVPSTIIGLTCALFSCLGIFIGHKARSLAGKKAETIGGIMLILIGLKILLEHLAA